MHCVAFIEKGKNQLHFEWNIHYTFDSIDYARMICNVAMRRMRIYYRGGWSPILIRAYLPYAAIYAHATQVNPLSQQNNTLPMVRDN